MIKENIPAQLAELERWVQRTSFKHGGVGWNTPSNWHDLDGIDGDAMLVSTDTDLFIVDADHVVNGNGAWIPEAREDYERIRKAGGATYEESSVSGHGRHLVYDCAEYPDEPLSPIRIRYPDRENWDGGGKVPQIEIWYAAKHCFRLTGKVTENSTDSVMGGEGAANALRTAKQIVTERSNDDSGATGMTDAEIERLKRSTEPIPDGSGHAYAVARVAELVTSAGDVLTDQQIADIVYREMQSRFQGELKETFFANAIKDAARFRKKIRAGRKDREFCAYSVRAWEAENGKTFSDAGKPWKAAFVAGLKAQEEGKTFDKPAKTEHYDLGNLDLYGSEASDNAQPAAPEAPPVLTEREAILCSRRGERVPLILNQDNSISKSSFTNFVQVLKLDAYLKNRIRFNAFDGRITCTGFYWDTTPHPVRDADLSNIRFFMDRRYGLSNKNNTSDALTKVACDNVYHPVREYLEGLKWDGELRISELLPRYLGAERSEYTTAVTKLMFYGAIQRVMHPGCKFDYCIILADHLQGTGKSSLCRFLALNDAWYTDSIGNLNDSKNVFELMRGKWVIELGEMLAVKRAQDVETIKAFISRQSQPYRQAYGIFAEEHPRQCLFIGTTNKPQFLPQDATGNRRFLPVICNGEKAETHPLANEAETREFIKQCYAEALVIGKEEGFPLVLDDSLSDELLRVQASATPEDTWPGMIQEFLDTTDLSIVCSRLIWDSVFAGDDKRQPKRFELNDIAEIMELQVEGWKRYKGRDGSNDRAKYKFQVYGSQNAWCRVESRRNAAEFDGNISKHNGLNGYSSDVKREVLRMAEREEKVASGVATGVASSVASAEIADFERVGFCESVPFD